MSKLKNIIVDKKTRYGVNTKTGLRTKIGTAVKLDNGNQVLLLNPNGKGAKAARELKENKSYTNDLKTVKKNYLTKTQRAYRAGYLQARSDNAKAFKAKGGKK